MSHTTLSKTYIEIAENFIASTKPNDNYPAISECDREQTIDCWIEINKEETPVTSYLQFADASLGMVSYGYYKAQNGNIYILCAYCNSLTRYCNVDDSWDMLKPFLNIETDYNIE